MHMADVSVRELRNETAQVVARVRAGEPVTLTVNGAPVADIVAHRGGDPGWASAADLRALLSEPALMADRGLLDDIADVRGALIED